MSLRRRLDALERVVSGKWLQLPCAECGARGGAEEVRVVLLDEDEELHPGCDACRRSRTPDGRLLALGATVVLLADLNFGDREELEPPGGEEEDG